MHYSCVFIYCIYRDRSTANCTFDKNNHYQFVLSSLCIIRQDKKAGELHIGIPIGLNISLLQQCPCSVQVGMCINFNYIICKPIKIFGSLLRSETKILLENSDCKIGVVVMSDVNLP